LDLKPDLDRHHLTEVIGLSRIFDSLHEALAALRGSAPLLLDVIFNRLSIRPGPEMQLID
jgi:hypothetical protein